MDNLPKDSVMLLSYVNLKLRDNYDNLDMLCDDLNISKDEITSKLAAIDYAYDESINQFT